MANKTKEIASDRGASASQPAPIPEQSLRESMLDGPSMPEANVAGNFPAQESIRVILARQILCRRLAAGLSQVELAQRAHVRLETLCRIETAQPTPNIRSVDKIDAALRAEGV